MMALRLISSIKPNFCENKGVRSMKILVTRFYYQKGRETIWKTAGNKRRTFYETINQRAGDTAFTIGKGAVAGGAALGLGALCYYGFGLSNEVGAIETSRIWPQYVRDRIHDTYMYFGSSVMLIAASSAFIYRSPTMFNLVSKNSTMAFVASLAAVWGCGILTRSIEYSPGFGLKQMAWMLHCSVIGAIIAPACIVGGPILMRAAVYTMGIVGGLSTVAVCAPSDKFLNMGGPLAMGLGVVLVSCLGTMFLPPTTALGAGLMSISLYGGLLLFSGLLLYDTQKIIRMAEIHPVYSNRPYDPINASMSVYMDTVNIFIRLVTMFSMGSGSNKKH